MGNITDNHIADDDKRNKVKEGDARTKRCSAMQESIVKSFYLLWNKDNNRMLGGEWRSYKISEASKSTQYWWPDGKNANVLREAAQKVIFLK